MEYRTIGSSRFHLIQTCEASLRRFGTDYVDLYQLHGFDALTSTEEVLRALDDLVRAGKVRYIGCSNFSGWHLMKALVVSDRYGLARLPVTASKGPPVADDYVYRVVDAIDQVAKETGKSVPQIALNWLLQRPTVANVIIGARNEEQLRQNLGAVGWNLTADQVARLDAASATAIPYPYWHQRTEYADRNPPPVR